jgi:transcription factor MBP1
VFLGTWVPLDRGLALARQYNVEPLLRPIIDFTPAANSPPLAPKHITAPPTRPKRKDPPDIVAISSQMGTRSRKAGDDDSSMSRSSSPRGSEDGSMTTSPSEVSSSSRTPSPIRSSPALSHYSGSHRGSPYPPASRKRKNPSSSQDLGNHHRQHSSRSGDPQKYGEIILEYFISDTSQIPNLLISPPSDFDPNMAIDDDGHTALHWACAMGRVRVVKLLLTSGADIFRVNKAGQTALMRSVMFANNYDVRKFPELYELLHRSTLNIDHFNRTVFHHIVDVAMTKGKTHAARYYMETILNRLSDFPQELADIINFQDEDGETALTMAARCRSKRLVKLLIDHGADPKIANRDSKTTEDYILEDERFRASPVLRSQTLSIRNGPSTSSHLQFPRLHHSNVAERATGKCTNEMAQMLDSLANSFDAELTEKERDLNQANALLSNIQAEILESQRAVQALKAQAAGLDPAKQQLTKLQEELLAKMGKRYRLGWEKWSKDEEAREKAWKSSTTGAEVNGDAKDEEMPGLLDSVSDLVDLHDIPNQKPQELHDACEALRAQVAQHRKRRKEAFEEFVKHQAESGTGGKMSEYRRLIGAGCGGVPVGEVDNVLGLLLEVCLPLLSNL